MEKQPERIDALGSLTALNKKLSELVGVPDQNIQDRHELLSQIEFVRQLEITRDLIEESNIHATINKICKNKFIERSKPEVFEKIKELKNLWKSKLKEVEETEEKNTKKTEISEPQAGSSSKPPRAFEFPGRRE